MLGQVSYGPSWSSRTTRFRFSAWSFADSRAFKRTKELMTAKCHRFRHLRTGFCIMISMIFCDSQDLFLTYLRSRCLLSLSPQAISTILRKKQLRVVAVRDLRLESERCNQSMDKFWREVWRRQWILHSKHLEFVTWKSFTSWEIWFGDFQEQNLFSNLFQPNMT